MTISPFDPGGFAPSAGPARRLGAAIAVSVALIGAAPAAAQDVSHSERLLVETVQARMQPGRLTVSLIGEIAARNTLNASFPTAGRIAAVRIEEGDRVVAGQELARIDAVSQEQNLRSRQAALTTAKANLTRAESDFRRQDALLERGATTRAARDAADDALRSAEASMAETRAALDLAEKDLADTVLVSPGDALVTARAAEVGQVVGAAETVIELALGAEYDAVIDVPEGLLSVPRDAPPVRLELLEVDTVPFAGTIREVSPLVDPDLGTVQVKVAIHNPPRAVSIGETVRGTVNLGEPPVVALPFSALGATAQGAAVWIMDPDDATVSLRQVDVLRHETDRVLIREGLSEGETVVTAGGQLLFEGQKVRAARVEPGDAQ
ncbi:efflux RND transporter periplasmic adaptor subunit [Oceaniglobus indicus]|uniref:efflux RND transporter periplasmic adaptor subunit n=1 Tax=Oceaniglobus indicus TaxID=2047749 RepID=UPI00130407B5|nr:efflux RND transporter periplasmic adaptor subunit [Oceaniglobus indicus]